MPMTQGSRKRVRGIRRRRPIQAQQTNHHVLDLLLGRVAGARNRLLDLPWRVLMHGQTRRERGAQCRCTSMPKLQGAACVLVHKDAFDSEFLRLVFSDQLFDGHEDLPQAIGKFAVGRAHCATRDKPGAIVDEVDNAESGQAGARVYAENAYAATQASASERGQNLIGDIGIAVDVLDVVQILEHFQ